MKFFHKIAAPFQSMKKKYILIAAVATVLLVATGITLAFLFTETDPVTNTFTPSKVSSLVVEDFQDNVKSNVKVKNDGDTEAYIRVFVNITWMSHDDSQVTINQPAEGTDYTVSYTTDANWQKGADGYWYYKLPVVAGEQTSVLIDEAKLLATATPPEGFFLSVEIVSSAIQSKPTSVVTEQWSSGVSAVAEDGTLTVTQ